jgi:hypothetical protein
VLEEGRLLQHGAATFAAFSSGRSWRYRLRCPGQAEAAAALVARLTEHASAFDANTLDCTPTVSTGSSRPPIAAVTDALLRAGIAVEATGLHPDWPEQLVEQTT